MDVSGFRVVTKLFMQRKKRVGRYIIIWYKSVKIFVDWLVFTNIYGMSLETQLSVNNWDLILPEPVTELVFCV